MDPSELAGPQPRIPRPPRPGTGKGSNSRNSNALRASVLDVALELGIGSSSLVTNWMFDNSLQEEEEDSPLSSPGLTRGSSATSSPNPASPPLNAGVPFLSSTPVPFPRPDTATTSGTSYDIAEADRSDVQITQSQSGNLSFLDAPAPSHPPRSTTPSGGLKKLRKKFKDKDGYESDRGYVSDVVGKKDKDKKKSKKGDGDSTMVSNGVGPSEKELKARAKEEKAREKLDKEIERKRTKSLASAAKSAKKEAKEVGYDTDVSAAQKKKKKGKKSSGEGAATGDETDGYQSTATANSIKKTRSLFSKLKGKSSRTDIKAEEEPVPALPAAYLVSASLPIASKFSTTSKPAPDAASTVSTVDVVEPIPPPTTLPALSFQQSPSASDSFMLQPSPSLAESLPTPTPTRDSQSSSDSTFSSSGSSRRPGGPFSPTTTATSRDSESISSHQHGHTYHESGTGSISTINSTSSVPSLGLPYFGSARSLSPIPDSTTPEPQEITPMLKPPTISFPNTRSASPSPSVSSPPPSSSGALASALNSTSSPPTSGKFGKGLRAKLSLENIMSGKSMRSSGSTASPISPASPYLFLTPASGSSPLSSPATSTSQQGSGTGGAAPRSRSPLPMATASSPLTPTTPIGRVPRLVSPLMTDGIDDLSSTSPLTPGAGSRRYSPLSSPGATAQYDLPPPNPPPLGPLPSVPRMLGAGAEVISNDAVRQGFGGPAGRIQTPAYSQNDVKLFPVPAGGAMPLQQLPGVRLTNVKRGKESPFPARPARIGMGGPALGVPAMSGMASGRTSPNPGGRPVSPPAQRGYDDTHWDDTGSARASTEESAGTDHSWEDLGRGRTQHEAFPPSAMRRTGKSRGRKVSFEDERPDYDEPVPVEEDEVVVSPMQLQDSLRRSEDSQADGFQDIIDRFTDQQPSRKQSDVDMEYALRPREPPIALERGQSLDAFTIHATTSQTPDEDHLDDSDAEPTGEYDPTDAVLSHLRQRPESEFEFEDGRTLGDRTSRWSGSIYSRVSVLDADESGKTRDRLVRGVEAMLAAEKKAGVVPPVPRLPDQYARENLRWNKF